MNTATAAVNGVVTAFTPTTRPGFVTTPVLASVTVAVPMDRDVLVAALFEWADLDAPREALASDDQARALIVEAVANLGLQHVEGVRCDIDEMAADDPRHAWLEFCRQRVTELFSPAPRRTRRPNRRSVASTVARELVTA